MKNVLRYYSILIVAILFFTSCEKENLNKTATSEISLQEQIAEPKSVTRALNGNFFSAAYRPILCTRGRYDKFAHDCVPSWLGSCLIAFPPMPTDRGLDDYFGVAHVSSADELVIDVFAYNGDAGPINGGSTFEIYEDQYLQKDIIDELFTSVGMQTPSSYIIPSGIYPAVYEEDKLKVNLVLGEKSVLLNVWGQACLNPQDLAGNYHNEALSYLMKPEYWNNYSKDPVILNNQIHENLNNYLEENNLVGYDFSYINIAEIELTPEGLLNSQNSLTNYEKELALSFANEVLEIDGYSDNPESQILEIIKNYECAILADGNIENYVILQGIFSTARNSTIYWNDFRKENRLKVKPWVWIALADGLSFGLMFVGSGGNPLIGGIAAASFSGGVAGMLLL